MAIVPLDSFFTDFITEALKPIPDNAPVKEYSVLLNNKQIPYYIIDDRRGMFFENIAVMLNAKITAVQKRFNILTKRVRLDKKRFYLMENQHYIYVERSKLDLDSKSTSKIHLRGSRRPFVFWEGVTIILGFMRGEIRDEVYLAWNANLYIDIRKQQLLKHTPKTVYELPVFSGMLYSRNYTMCASKFETTVCDIFYEFGIDIRRMDYYHKSKLSQKSKNLLTKNGLNGIDFDFFVTTKPFTIIDVQGVEKKFTYQFKKDVCKIEGWSLFIIKKDEDKNIPKLHNRIKKYFVGSD